MPDANAVFERLKQLFPSADESALPFCETAAAVLGSRIRRDVDASDILLLTAAAAVAYCDYLSASSTDDGGIASFRAGDITVRKEGKAVETAAKYRDTALSYVAHMLSDNDFDFRTV